MVHYQIPATVDVYVHRSGRTARANEDGLAVALVTPREAARYIALQQVCFLTANCRIFTSQCEEGFAFDPSIVLPGVVLV